MFFVYIIQSQQDGSYYKGFSVNPLERLRQHNEGKSAYTSSKVPWKLVFVQVYLTKKEALIRERRLKKFNHASLLALIQSKQNQLNEIFRENR